MKKEAKLDKQKTEEKSSLKGKNSRKEKNSVKEKNSQKGKSNLKGKNSQNRNSDLKAHKKVKGKSVGKKAPYQKEWFYFHTATNCSAEHIADLLEPHEELQIEFWKDAGVVEIALPCGKHIDFEEALCDLREEEGNAFLKEHQIQSLLWVTIPEEAFEEAKPLLEEIVHKMGGFFAANTQDFKPRIFHS